MKRVVLALVLVAGFGIDNAKAGCGQQGDEVFDIVVKPNTTGDIARSNAQLTVSVHNPTNSAGAMTITVAVSGTTNDLGNCGVLWTGTLSPCSSDTLPVGDTIDYIFGASNFTSGNYGHITVTAALANANSLVGPLVEVQEEYYGTSLYSGSIVS